MSALAAALAAFASSPSKPVLDILTIHPEVAFPSSSQSPATPSSCCSALPSLTNSSCESSSVSSSLHFVLPTVSTRRNEHLAVLLPKNLWKPDSLASHCDYFYCRVKFSVFERRHHCRKCGGIYCKVCSSRTTPLLDTSTLSFLHPPRNVPLAAYESPLSPIIPSRVCDDCWEQLHGYPTPRTPDISLASPLLIKNTLPSKASSISSSISTPPNGLPVMSRRTLRTAQSLPHLRRSRNSSFAVPETVAEIEAPNYEPSYGELNAYPLRRSSAICKASGGGRWEPKQSPPHPGYRIPGGKAPFEIEMEQEEEHARLRRLNPVIRDGAFQYRFVHDPDRAFTCSPFQFPAF